jgi:hypothetical protein
MTAEQQIQDLNAQIHALRLILVTLLAAEPIELARATVRDLAAREDVKRLYSGMADLPADSIEHSIDSAFAAARLLQRG